jgi:hypothetical protein
METKTIRLAKGRETGCSVKMLLVKVKAARAALPAGGRPRGVGRSRTIRVSTITTAKRPFNPPRIAIGKIFYNGIYIYTNFALLQVQLHMLILSNK